MVRRRVTELKWLGTVAGIAGALLIALNVGGTIVGIGFIFFAVSATAWVVAAWRMGFLRLHHFGSTGAALSAAASRAPSPTGRPICGSSTRRCWPVTTAPP